MAAIVEEEVKFNSLLVPWKNSDIVLVVQGQEFHVHRSILSLQSPVFDAMLNAAFKEARQDKITLRDKVPEHMRDFLKLLYPLNIFNNPLRDENRLEMLALADEYQTNGVIKQCLDEATITEKNALAILPYAEKYNRSIRDQCISVAQRRVMFENLKEGTSNLVQSVRDELWMGKCKLMEDTLEKANVFLLLCMKRLCLDRLNEHGLEGKAVCCFSHEVTAEKLRSATECKACLTAYKKNFCDSTIMSFFKEKLATSQSARQQIKTQQLMDETSKEFLNSLIVMDNLLSQRPKRQQREARRTSIAMAQLDDNDALPNWIPLREIIS